MYFDGEASKDRIEKIHIDAMLSIDEVTELIMVECERCVVVISKSTHLERMEENINVFDFAFKN